MLKKLCNSTGTDSQNFSSHCFRRGGASWAFHAWVPVELIQLQGDWTSDCFKKYLPRSFGHQGPGVSENGRKYFFSRLIFFDVVYLHWIGNMILITSLYRVDINLIIVGMKLLYLSRYSSVSVIRGPADHESICGRRAGRF